MVFYRRKVIERNNIRCEAYNLQTWDSMTYLRQLEYAVPERSEAELVHLRVMYSLIYRVRGGPANDRYVHYNSYQVRLLSLFDCPAPIYNFIGSFCALLSHLQSRV